MTISSAFVGRYVFFFTQLTTNKDCSYIVYWNESPLSPLFVVLMDHFSLSAPYFAACNLSLSVGLHVVIETVFRQTQLSELYSFMASMRRSKVHGIQSAPFAGNPGLSWAGKHSGNLPNCKIKLSPKDV
jgi:hypothetical protein